MNILEFTVTKNHLVKTGAVTTTAGSTLYDYAQFTFDSDWVGLDIVVYFSRGTAVYTPSLISGTDLTDLLYAVPNELLAVAGAYEINAVGTDDTGVRIVTNKVSQPVDKSGYTDGTIPITPTPSLYAQMLTEFNEATAACEEYAEDALNAQHAAEEAAASVPDLTEAVADAQTAQAGAEAAQAAIEGMTVSASEVAAGGSPTVTKTTAGGIVNLAFGLVTGATGDTGETGATGATGNGIASIVRTSGDGSAGTTDTYTITYTDETTDTFTVYNGADGEGSGDMLASTYDTNADGSVNLADALKSGSYKVTAGTLAEDKTLGTAAYTATTAYEASGAVSTHNTNASAHSTEFGAKADKVSSPTNGNFAGLDTNGNLTDSGKKASDFAEASHTHLTYADKTTITANTDAAPALGTIANNNEYRCTNASITTAPTMTIAAIASTSTEFVCAVIFKAPNATIPTITNNSGYTLKYQGQDVTSGTWTPISAKIYRMSFVFDGIYLNIYISGVAA